MFRLALGLALVPAAVSAADGVIAVVNVTDQPVTFTVKHDPAAAGRSVTVPAGRTVPVPVGRRAEVVTVGPTPGRFAVDPFAAYAFVDGDKGVVFQGVELAGPLPKPDDVVVTPTERAPLKIPVKLLCDAADPRVRAVWERALRARVADANVVLERQVAVTLDVAQLGEWPGDGTAADMPAALKSFAARVPTGDARLVIGFTPRALGFGKAPKGEKGATEQYGTVTGPLGTHILMREGLPRTDAERTEALVHTVGRWLGAAGSPDPGSVMRASLGDGQATRVKFAVQFDPLNLLIAHVWAGELRAGKVTGWSDLAPPARARLTVLYKTLQVAHPNDPGALDAVEALARLADAGAAVAAAPVAPVVPGVPDKPVKPNVEPAAAVDAPPPAADARRAAIRQVVCAISIKAAEIRDAPAATRPRGDKLTAELVKTAADVAHTAGGEHARAAFLVGLGIGLDDSTILRSNPVTRNTARAAETEAEFAERKAALGRPSLRGRRDLCQHFAVSAALTEIVGAKGAELAGLTKEMSDLGGDSGFSFPDLLADLAGVKFAQGVLADANSLVRIRQSFDPDAVVPPLTGLREGLTRQRFEADFGGLSDPRFQAALADVRKRVADHGK